MAAVISLIIYYSKYGYPSRLIETVLGTGAWDKVIGYALTGIRLFKGSYVITNNKLIQIQEIKSKQGLPRVEKKSIPEREYDNYIKRYLKINEIPRKYNKYIKRWFKLKEPPRKIDDPVSPITSIIFSYIETYDKQAFEDALGEYAAVFQRGLDVRLPLSLFIDLESYIIDNAFKHLEEIIEVLESKQLYTWLENPIYVMAGIGRIIFSSNEKSAADTALDYYKRLGHRFIVGRNAIGTNAIIESLWEFLKAAQYGEKQVLFDSICEILGGLGERIPVYWHRKSEVEPLIIGDEGPYYTKYNPIYKIAVTIESISELIVENKMDPSYILKTSHFTLSSLFKEYDKDAVVSSLIYRLLEIHTTVITNMNNDTEWPKYYPQIIHDLTGYYREPLLSGPTYGGVRDFIAMSLAKAAVYSIERKTVYPRRNRSDNLVDDLIQGLISTDPSKFEHIAYEMLVGHSPGSPSIGSRWDFVKRFGIKMRNNWGLRFDPLTGEDYPDAST